MNRRIWVGAGLLAAGLGIAFALYPPLASSLSVTEVFVVMVGLAAIVQGLRIAQARYGNSMGRGEPSTPEEPISLTTPGDDVDSVIAEVSGITWGGARARQRLRDRLTEAAVTVLMRRRDYSREQALSAISEGNWTDDPLAASFLGDLALPWRTRLWIMAARQPRYQLLVERTIDEIAALAGVTDDGQH